MRDRCVASLLTEFSVFIMYTVKRITFLNHCGLRLMTSQVRDRSAPARRLRTKTNGARREERNTRRFVILSSSRPKTTKLVWPQTWSASQASWFLLNSAAWVVLFQPRRSETSRPVALTNQMKANPRERLESVRLPEGSVRREGCRTRRAERLRRLFTVNLLAIP